VFGPTRINRFGNPATVVPRCAWAPPDHTWASVRPSRLWIQVAIGMSVTWNPVPKITVSTCRRVLSSRGLTVNPGTTTPDHSRYRRAPAAAG
jgi:hypothetical protein